MQKKVASIFVYDDYVNSIHLWAYDGFWFSVRKQAQYAELTSTLENELYEFYYFSSYGSHFCSNLHNETKF